MDADVGNDSFTSNATVRMLTNAEKGTLHLNGREMSITIYKTPDGRVFAVPARPQSAAHPPPSAPAVEGRRPLPQAAAQLPPTAPLVAPPLSAVSADVATQAGAPAPPIAASRPPLPPPAQPPVVRWAPAPRAESRAPPPRQPTGDGHQPAAQPNGAWANLNALSEKN